MKLEKSFITSEQGPYMHACASLSNLVSETHPDTSSDFLETLDVSCSGKEMCMWF